MNASLPWSLLLALIFTAGLGLWAQDRPGESTPSDRELRASLDRGSDELDRELFGPQEKGVKPKAVPSKMPPGKDEPKQPAGEPGNAAAAEPGNPLVTISRQMREAERLIARSNTGPKTQELQERILVQLQELLQKKCSQCAGGQCAAKPNEPKKGPDERKSKPGETKRADTNVRTPKGLKAVAKTGERPTSNKPVKPSMEERKAMIRQIPWGQLPQRQREQMLQLGSFEEFLPKYDAMIEEYFKRLAEDKESGSVTPAQK